MVNSFLNGELSSPEGSLSEEPKISGFDAGPKSILKEPSLYLSIAILLFASSMTLGNNPLMFWLVFLSLSAVAVFVHIFAERSLFLSREGYEKFSPPCEGFFILTFGSILPGLGLLAYALYSLFNTMEANGFAAVGKMALVLIVPILNFAVWSSVRKRYLIRPRLIGLMNGLAVGLSASWTMIWLKCFFASQSPVYCKFGWMLLLCMSPFLLFAAISLGLELWRKTEPSIGRIARTFSLLGVLLSSSFVFAPMIHALLIQSNLQEARQSSLRKQEESISFLRCIATKEDLRPSEYPITGFGLAELLIPNRGLGDGPDKDLYFRITGNTYQNSERKADGANDGQPDQFLGSSIVGPQVRGLSLTRSQISGSIDPASLSSSIDWTMIFHNVDTQAREARSEIALPVGAVVSRVTLWINGQAQEGAFGSTVKTREAYRSIVARSRDPLLVTMSGTDRVIVQCSPVPAGGGEMKIRLGLKVPIDTCDGTSCSMQLPNLLSTNFTPPKRHRVHLSSQEMFLAPNIGTVARNTRDFSVDGIIKGHNSVQPLAVVSMKRTVQLRELATPDWYSRGKQFIVQRLQEATTFVPKRLVVVIDSSASLKNDASQIKEALSSIPSDLRPIVYFSSEANSENPKECDITASTLTEALATVESGHFVGGQDNAPALREALEDAAEHPAGAVLWIHGPQPFAPKPFISDPLDLVHNLQMYDFQIQPGPNSVLESVRLECLGNMVSYSSVLHESTVAKDLKTLFASWSSVTKKVVVVRKTSKDCPNIPVVLDRLVSAQITCLWAKEEVARLMTSGQTKQAEMLAGKYRVVTPVTGVVVLERQSDYAAHQLDPGNYQDAPEQNSSETSSLRTLRMDTVPVGASEPRYGQSNEVGMLADYGYDTARDISRVITALSWLVSIPLGIMLIRSRRRTGTTTFTLAKGIALAISVPTAVHLLGTFMINNYGGLGGGL